MIIYIATNKVNGKVYIGKTKFSLNARKRMHERSKKNFLFCRALRKHGVDNFEWKILVKDVRRNIVLNRLERHYIYLYSSNNKKYGYNLTEGGEGISNPSEETRKKMSINQLGKNNSNFIHGKFSGEHYCKRCRKQLSSMNEAVLCKSCCKIGKRFTQLHRKNLSLSKIGDKNPVKKLSVRKKISRTVKKLWREKKCKKAGVSMGSSAFFQNKDCEFWGKCHSGIDEEDFSCLFCYCPWFWDCGIKDDGMSCPDCIFPHQRDMYPYVMEGLKSMYERRKISVDANKPKQG